jgi:hypothetical protein
VILALIGAANAITYRPYGPPKVEEKAIEFEDDDERVSVE